MWQLLMCFNVREGPREDQGDPGQSWEAPREPWIPSLAFPWAPLALPVSRPDIEAIEKLPLGNV
jgi:hypothetical protein